LIAELRTVIGFGQTEIKDDQIRVNGLDLLSNVRRVRTRTK